GVVILRPKVFEDARGYFFENFSQRVFEREVSPIRFVQDNQSSSVRGVIRGLHFQRPPHAQAKLVSCVVGRVLDVAVDIRKGSPTYGHYVATELSDENHLHFFIPKGFAHGFSVLSDVAVFQYKCDNYYAPESEGGLALDDEVLNIDWGLELSGAILSDKDRNHPMLKDFDSPFIYNSSDLKP
ncbi:MAG: dTDP-4-dehydrorhamnose 3,5-epimerase, partial [Muribaculaceae bacterium]|nr:dTDP-4-dehydrorhamnose 3,5-epimerase [Muribaculaceae bacterium]